MTNREFELLDFEREDSICYVSPQTRLLHALEARHLEKFKEILRSNRKPTIDVDHVYEDPYNKSLLEIACSFPHCSRFVEVLINYGAEINSVNLIYKKSPLHLAIEFSDFDTVKLLAEITSNVNIRDSFGNTPLHKASELNKTEIVDLLLQHPGIKVNAVNRKKQTPLHLAISKANQHTASKLIEDIRVDLDELRDFSGKTCREMIRDKLPNIELQPSKRIGVGEITLFSLLHDREVQTFKQRCSDNKSNVNVNDDDGKYTYLQYACMYGLPDVVEVLLKNGANPNLTCYQHPTQPIMIAARQGFIKIVEMLVEHGNIIYDAASEGTVLHAALDGMTKSHDVLGVSSETIKHVKCLEYLLQHVSPNLLNINAANINGHTALHLAVKLHDKYLIRLLLDHGAYIGSRCNQGNMPISLIDADVFQEYLDDCVVTNEKRPIEENYEIIYKYHFLVPPKVCTREALASKGTSPFETSEGGASDKRAVVSETEPLIELSRIPELRYLLKHPVLTSFLNLKWFTIRKYFWVNFSIYILFWLSLTGYVLTVYSIERNDDEKELAKSRNAEYAKMLWYPTIVFWFLLLVRELFQFSVSPKRYLSDFENLLEIGLLVSAILILFCRVGSKYAAIAILLSWAELVLLIGRHPWLSTNIEMFKVVCKTFVYLLAWYSIFILAFALSFYLLFKDARKSSSCTPEITDATTSQKNDTTASDDDDDVQFFENVGTSVFKAVIMLTGEFDASSIPFRCHPGISHILFVLFVFLIAIVLFNLLNGLAVSDTQAIRNHAEIVGNECRAKLIAYIEKMAIGNPLSFLNIFDRLTCMCCCLPAPPQRKSRFRSKHIKLFYERINLFPNVLSDMSGHVLPNQGNLVDFSNSITKCQSKTTSENASCWGGCGQCTQWYIERGIMKLAKEILVERNTRGEKVSNVDSIERYSMQLREYEEKLASLEETSKSTENKLNEVIELLKKRR